MADFKMSDYETPDKYVYDTIEELIATENKGLVLKNPQDFVCCIHCHVQCARNSWYTMVVNEEAERSTAFQN